MPKSKQPRPPLAIAPEFSSRGRLASILKPGSGTPTERVEPVLSADDQSWTVFGVGAIWQTAAENAARLEGVELGDWLAAAVKEAASAAKES